ncbi:MAG TPA: PEP-CTERM sorting domain-containing protein [Bryobacteraceae bacterium]|jgi:hypothetical protein|nr:PEP-CTERM sorting domain-containing protein [Bryobacteraceae bacterium]
MHLRNLFVVVLSCAPALLEARNPTILIKDPTTGIPITSNTFAFGADPNGGGVLDFQNVSGKTWSTIDVTATLPDLTPITCGPGPFLTCTVSEQQVSDGWFYNILFGPTKTPIPNLGTFEVDLNDTGNNPDGSGSWPASQDFTGYANTTHVNPAPEPASLLLLGAGGLLIGFGQRRRLFPKRS